MRAFRRILTTLLLAALLLSTLPLIASAAATATIAFSSSSLKPGDTLTVTLTFSGDTVGAVDASLSYDSAVLQFVSGDSASGGGGVLRIAAYASSEGSSLRVALTFKALTAGSSTIQITGSSVYAWDESLIGNPTAGATVRVTDVSLSQNADLKSLRLSAGSLSPSFSAGTTSYRVSVGHDVSSLTISAVAADSDATVRVSGSSALPEGTSTRTITVTAPGGATKTYTLTITRAATPKTTTPSDTPEDTPTTTAPSSDEPPLTLTYEGDLYTVSNDLSDKPVPEGYTIEEIVCGDRTVSAAVSENGAIRLLWLVPVSAAPLTEPTDAPDATAADTTAPTDATEPTAPADPDTAAADTPAGGFFVYNAEEDYLFPYRPFETANGTFLLRPVAGAEADASLTAARWDLDGQTIDVWTFPQPERGDFCVLYAIDPEGRSGFFCYDTVEKTAQRYVAVAVNAPADVTTAPTAAAPSRSGGTLFGISIGWFVAAGLLLVCIALAVLAVMFHRRSLAPPRH